MKSHYAILSSLYELYKSNMNNEAILDKIGTISWALEFDLGFDSQGYHELAGLVKSPASDKVSIEHYTKVIEESLIKLSDRN